MEIIALIQCSLWSNTKESSCSRLGPHTAQQPALLCTGNTRLSCSSLWHRHIFILFSITALAVHQSVHAAAAAVCLYVIGILVCLRFLLAF